MIICIYTNASHSFTRWAALLQEFITSRWGSRGMRWVVLCHVGCLMSWKHCIYVLVDIFSMYFLTLCWQDQKGTSYIYIYILNTYIAISRCKQNGPGIGWMDRCEMKSYMPRCLMNDPNTHNHSNQNVKIIVSILFQNPPSQKSQHKHKMSWSFVELWSPAFSATPFPKISQSLPKWRDSTSMEGLIA